MISRGRKSGLASTSTRKAGRWLFALKMSVTAPSARPPMRGKYQLKIAGKSWEQLKWKIREITRKTTPKTVQECIEELNRLMRGWVNYFKHATGCQKFKDLDAWIRCRLRYCIWKQWKRPRRRLRAFLQLGVEAGWARRFACSRMGGPLPAVRSWAPR